MQMYSAQGHLQAAAAATQLRTDAGPLGGDRMTRDEGYWEAAGQLRAALWEERRAAQL